VYCSFSNANSGNGVKTS